MIDWEKWLPWKGWCTLWPDGIWGDCCEEHDHLYSIIWYPRRVADMRLWHCVHASSFSNSLSPLASKAVRFIAWLMFHGVRIFGWPFKKRRRKEDRMILILGE